MAEVISYSVKFLNPDKIINELEIYPGMTIAHFGSSVGYFTFPLAQKVGECGSVYALDVSEAKIDAVKSRAKMMNLSNIAVRRVNLEEKEGSKIAGGSVDWVIIANMLYQNEHKSRIIEEAKRILKKEGRILLIEWASLDSSIGPEIRSRISKEELIKIIRRHKLGISKEINAGDFHFGLILVK